MYYTIYKITNNLDGKSYIGMHQTNNIDDGYMGSGKHLGHAKLKYGIENFTKKILFVFDNHSDMVKKEIELVTESWCADTSTYNIRKGGKGGFTKENSSLGRKRADVAIKEKYNVENPSQLECNRKKASVRMTQRNLLKQSTFDNFRGKTHTEETKDKISKSQKERLLNPENNSQYGKRWIHSLEESRSTRISKTEPIPESWFEGRKMKF